MDETPVAAADAARRPLNDQQAEELVIATITRHADAVLRTARRYSLCADDAQDAYQRGVEILLGHAHRLDPERAGSWLHTVVRHEAMAVRRSRARLVGAHEVDLDALEANTTASPEERALDFEDLARSAEALKRLKPQEVRALWLKAAGNSYREICDATGWTYTKVNRCLTEGRRSFLERYASIEAGEECLRWQPILSAMVDGEATGDQLVELRPHLRNCQACRATVRALHAGGTSLIALFPPAAVAVTPADLEQAGGFLTRLYEVVSLTFHERAASAVLRANAVIEMATAHKTAAIAASAVAVASGGLAVEEATDPRKPAGAAPAVAAAERSAPRRDAAAAGALAARAPRRPARAAVRVASAPALARNRAADPARSTKAIASHGEPLVDPVESRPVARSTTATVRSARAIPATSTTSTTPATSTLHGNHGSSPTRTASSEFGFETP